MYVQAPGVPLAVPANGNVSSPAIPTRDLSKGAVGLQSTQAGQLSVQRYVDAAGVIPIGAAITAALTANTPAEVSWVDLLPCGSIIITVSNTAGTPAVVSNVNVLLQAY